MPQAGQLARPHGDQVDHVVAAGPPGPDRGADDVAPGVAGVGPDRRLPCHADDPGGVIGSAARVAPARPGGGDHGRGQRRGGCRELGVAALDVGVAVGHARLGVAADLPDGVVDVQVCPLLAPASSPAKRGRRAGPAARPLTGSSWSYWTAVQTTDSHAVTERSLTSTLLCQNATKLGNLLYCSLSDLLPALYLGTARVGHGLGQILGLAGGPRILTADAHRDRRRRGAEAEPSDAGFWRGAEQRHGERAANGSSPESA